MAVNGLSLNHDLAGPSAKARSMSAMESRENYCEWNGVLLNPIRSLDDATPAWFSLALNRDVLPDGFSVKPVGTGQMSSTCRVTFADTTQPDKQQSVICKFAAADDVTRKLGADFGHYTREPVFYRRFGKLLQAGLPQCFVAIVDNEGFFTLVLEDLGLKKAVQGDQLKGCTADEMRKALKCLAKLQAPVLNDPVLSSDPWLNEPTSLNQDFYNANYPIFLSRFQIKPDIKEVLDFLSNNLTAWEQDRQPPFAIFHGDFRLDNIMFTDDGAVAVDWGGLSYASAMRDAAYCIGNGMEPADRRPIELDLVRYYVDELNKLTNDALNWDQAYREYRRQSFYGLTIHIPAAGICPDTDRGRQMFQLLIERQAQHVIDCDAMSLVKPLSVAALVSPATKEEALHPVPADSNVLWNESYYFDAVAQDGSTGLFVRIGRLPLQEKCTFMAAIYRRDEPPLLLVDMNAVLPLADSVKQTISTSRFRYTQTCLEPLKRWHVELQGTADLLTDPTAALRGETPTNSDKIAFDLMWTTDALAYQKAGQTRYEVPCAVSGSFKYGNTFFSVTNAVGNRNHSWGVRDWWHIDWVWSTFHLEDATRIFTISTSTSSVGYIQRPGSFLELTSVHNDFAWDEDGLAKSMTTTLQPTGLSLDIRAISASGIRLVSPQGGKITHLPRAMCSVTTSEGIKGVGWVDWNRVR